MELGISPIVTSGLIMQLLAGAKLIGELNEILYVQKVDTHFIKLLYKMGHYFLDTQYLQGYIFAKYSTVRF